MADTKAQEETQKGVPQLAAGPQGDQLPPNTLPLAEEQASVQVVKHERGSVPPNEVDAILRSTPTSSDISPSERKNKRERQLEGNLEPEQGPDGKRQRLSPPSQRGNQLDKLPIATRVSEDLTSISPEDHRYPALLEAKGSYMSNSPRGISSNEQKCCHMFQNYPRSIPNKSLFSDSTFEKVCHNLANRNQRKVVQDISRLLVPSAEELGLVNDWAKFLIESVNEAWDCSMPLIGMRPQPDYSVGFRREAFNDGQLAKLSSLAGDVLSGDKSFFMATHYMYFPFLACEVKCGATSLEVADRQNAHSMTLAVRAFVELFKVLKREGELNRKILAFSVSHNHTSVRIFGHYPAMDGEDIKYYRHPIRSFSFTDRGGAERWTAYHFIKNVYSIWAPFHLKEICSAIDQLPANPES